MDESLKKDDKKENDEKEVKKLLWKLESYLKTRKLFKAINYFIFKNFLERVIYFSWKNIWERKILELVYLTVAI